MKNGRMQKRQRRGRALYPQYKGGKRIGFNDKMNKKEELYNLEMSSLNFLKDGAKIRQEKSYKT